MKKLLSFILPFFLLSNSYSQVNISSVEQKDNFSFYLLGVQSELFGDYQSALQLYDFSLKTSENEFYYPSLLRLLQLRLSSGDYGTETESLLNQVIKFSDDSVLIDNLKLDFYVGNNQYDKASDLCSRIIEKDPNNQNILRVLALIDFSQENFDSALDKINDFEIKFGFENSLYATKREILARKELYDSLLNYNIRVSTIYPDNYPLLSDLANVYSALGKDSIAFDLWNTVLYNDSTSLELLFKGNQFYSSRGYVDQTISTSMKILSSPYIVPEAKTQVFQNIFYSFDASKDSIHLATLDSALMNVALAEVDTTVVLDLALGYFYSFRKDFPNTFILLDSLISRSSSYLPVIQKSYILHSLGRSSEALSLLDSNIPNFLHISNLVLLKAEILRDSISDSQAIKYLNSVYKNETVDSIKSDYLSYIADIYYKKGKIKTAFKLYEKSLSITPNHALSLNNYAYFLALSGLNIDKALAMSHKCNSLVKNNTSYLDTEAYVLYLLGMYQQAKEMMDIVFSLDDDFSDEIYLHYADILKALNKTILAKSYYQKSLEAGADPIIISERLKSLE